MATRTVLNGTIWMGLALAGGCNGLLGVDGPPRGGRSDVRGGQSGGGGDLSADDPSGGDGGGIGGTDEGDAGSAGDLGGEAGATPNGGGAGALAGGASGSAGDGGEAARSNGVPGGAGGVPSGGRGGFGTDATGGIGGAAGGGQTAGRGGVVGGGTGGLGGGDGKAGAAGGGGVPSGPHSSCAGMVGDECKGESCCETIELPAGTFQMGQGESPSSDYFSSDGTYANERPEHSVTVSAFALDKYEVTVGRFRNFVTCKVDGTCSDWTPPAGTGANQAVEASNPALAGSTGWSANWELPPGEDAWDYVLRCNSGLETWTSDETGDESLPINCVSWYEAMAFCIWDGGRLPTEAEWEYVAAGGGENRLYPWGSAPLICELANFGNCWGSPRPVGSYESTGSWGHYDLAGNLWEWTFDTYHSDWYGNAGASGENVCSTAQSDNRVIRGGDFAIPSSWHRAASRAWGIPTFHSHFWGFRCAHAAGGVSADR